MNVLKQKMEKAFAVQQFNLEKLDSCIIEKYRTFIRHLTDVSNGCAVLTDMAHNRSYFSTGNFSNFLGLDNEDVSQEILDSLDEDCIYAHIHPDELLLKRTLELNFFLYLLNLPAEERLNYKASCKIRMLNNKNEYMYIANQTQILKCDNDGNMWLVLCLYDIAPDQNPVHNIGNKITNSNTGEILTLSLAENDIPLLSLREKEILTLIKDGLLSKEISGRLSISLNTVNRHRQNILEKFHVANSLEAVNYAQKTGQLG